MDGFMDKIAQKLNAQEMIRANAAADAAQIERLQAQTAEYDACMQEIRKLNLKSMESEEKLRKLMEESADDLKKLTQECMAKLQEAEKENGADAQAAEELKTVLEGHMRKLEELFTQSDDFAHKESVKVYRNVQAVIVEELDKRMQTLQSFGETSARREKQMLTVGIVTMAAALINIGLLIVHILGIF